jgi:hypothetical protein
MRQRTDKTESCMVAGEWMGAVQVRARQVPIEVVWWVVRGSSGECPQNSKNDGKEGLAIGRTEERAERPQKLKQYLIPKSLLS